MSKFLLSGGWGFGNLGDDAILLSTIEMIQHLDNNAEIGVFSYNKKETQKLLCQYKNVQVFRSIHSILFGNEFELQFLTHTHSIFQSMLLKFYYKYECVFFKFFLCCRGCLNILSVLLVRLRIIMQHYDYFCLAGGGYLNNWRASLIAKYLEAKVAKDSSLHLITFGQSIGPFSSNLYKEICVEILGMFESCSFRDIDSYGYVAPMQYRCRKAIPDYALYRSDSFAFEPPFSFVSQLPKQYVLFIIGYDNIENKVQLLAEYAFALRQKKNIQIVFSVSQLWNTVENAHYMTKRLKESGLDCTCIIPSNVFELEYLIKQSRLCLSQNLHALILAYKNHVPCIALNNRPKFHAFCEYSGVPILSIFHFNTKKAIEYTMMCIENKNYVDYSSVITEDFISLLDDDFGSSYNIQS